MMFFLFSESALKNVKSLKSLKQRCSALTISETSIRVVIHILQVTYKPRQISKEKKQNNRRILAWKRSYDFFENLS